MTFDFRAKYISDDEIEWFEQQKRAQWRAAGLCVECGADGCTTCHECGGDFNRGYIYACVCDHEDYCDCDACTDGHDEDAEF